jgi:S1-C subfamily serine protease
VILAAACLALVAAGCKRGNNGESVPETSPPEKSPAVSGERIYRPTFVLGAAQGEAGTGFFLVAPSGRIVALTASHVLEKNEWPTVRLAWFNPMAGAARLEVGRKPDYLGRSFDELTPHEGGRFPLFDTSEDFSLWVLPSTQKAVPVLELAEAEPKVNEWVWAAGAEGGKQFTLYRAKVTKVKKGTVMMSQHDKFAPRGFSGGPVFNANGKVVGNLLAADPDSGQMAGATAATIRQRISGY